MPPPQSTIRFHRGSDVRIPLRASPVRDLTGRPLRFVAARRLDEDAPLIDLPCTVTNGPAGLGHVDVRSTDTIDLDRGSYQWEVRDTTSGGRTVVAYGRLDLLGLVADW